MLNTRMKSTTQSRHSTRHIGKFNDRPLTANSRHSWLVPNHESEHEFIKADGERNA